MGPLTSLLCGSVWGQGSEGGLCLCLASGGLLSTCPVSTYSPYAIGRYPSGSCPCVESQGGFVYVLRLSGPFKLSFLKIWQFFLLPSSPPSYLFIYLSVYLSIYLFLERGEGKEKEGEK